MTKEKVIEIAKRYIGYEEKSSNAQLDDFHANRGSNNYTKFQPMAGAGNGDYWCQYFVDAVFVEAFGGMNAAEDALCMPKISYMSGYTPTCKNYFQNSKRWFTTPEIGDIVYFYSTSLGRVAHVGIVVSVAKSNKTFSTVEGNTSSTEYSRNGGCVATHSYSYASVGGSNRVNGFGRPIYKEESKAMFSEWDLRVAVNALCAKAKAEHWAYGDKKNKNQRVTSCDRMVFEALYNLGMRDQREGFETVVTAERYLLNHGFKKIVKKGHLQSGDIVLMKQAGENAPTWRWHMFLIDKYNSANNINKYDFGSQARINSGGWFGGVALNEWGNSKEFYCGFRCPKTDPKLANGYYKIVSALGDNWVLDVANGSLDRRANIQLYKDNGTAAQVFYVKSIGNGLYTISNKKSGLVFDIANGSKDIGASLWQYKINDTDAQKFYIQGAGQGFFTIINKKSGLVLDVADGKAAKRQDIRQWSSNDTLAQMFKFVKV